MKANNIPVTERLQSRIGKLYRKLDDVWIRISRGNPYRRCKHCGVTNVEFTSIGHYTGCPLKGIDKEIEHYERLLKRQMGL